MENDHSNASVYSASCPSRAALELVSSKWSLLIVPFLAAGPARNSELLRRIGGVSQKMLTQTLRELQRNGLVERIDYQTVPPHVEYRLSPLGHSLSQTLAVVDRWAETHHADLTQAQQRFDAADGHAGHPGGK
ncbi:putative HTH-type transcriptional regulator YtcD [Andreprevotia sp. IGB-42]|uniref:winged helix-turn-helix transcriptional regulator n=1 Tax=Andreprevotia sp. IGB-42 TaxID=2497473 RepID=UPI00135B65E7|nr:helix-turn-helix domain-containing protein [Andreprevotia sp. IGB-42]KAF0814966.1 putative HTH-type transcriptional regulator YtcD [Andreprevotia sp. IGB-42]